jgi:hypothetical protein
LTVANTSKAFLPKRESSDTRISVIFSVLAYSIASKSIGRSIFRFAPEMCS